MNKSQFLKIDLFNHLQRLSEHKKPVWGKMNARQMVEHLAFFIDISTEKTIFPLSVTETDLPKYKAFLMSEKQFRENTKAPSNVLGEETVPILYPDLQTSISVLQISVNQFFSFFKDNPEKNPIHPAFGHLNFDEWLLLHHKHATHHLRQFELIA
ncbi:MAG: DUF1569 domain-containing protein [Bacteroidota bacterium]|jgi:hypothetical protein